MKALILKELRWNWRSFRFPAVILVFVFFAMLSPPTVRYMNEILAFFADSSFLDGLLPEPNPVDAFVGGLADISQIGILVLIFTSMGIVAQEKETGVAGWMLSKPTSRRDYLLAKVICLFGAVTVALALAVSLAYLYTWSLLGQIPLTGAIWSGLALLVFTLVMATVSFCFSTTMRSPLQAGGLSCVVFFSSGVLNLLVSRVPSLRAVYPNTLLSEMPALAAGLSGPMDVAGPMVASLVLILALLALASGVFARADL